MLLAYVLPPQSRSGQCTGMFEPSASPVLTRQKGRDGALHGFDLDPIWSECAQVPL